MSIVEPNIYSYAYVTLANNIATVEARIQAVSKAKVRAKYVKREAEGLKNQVTKVEDWNTEPDPSIRIAMQSFVPKWEKKMEDLVDACRELEELVIMNDILADEDVGHEESLNLVSELEDTVYETLELIKAQDKERNLFSTCQDVTSTAKFPVFSGEDHEDFSKFKTEMEAAIISHRVPKQEQIKKLRDCLKWDA